jgi:hypothetical protein
MDWRTRRGNHPMDINWVSREGDTVMRFWFVAVLALLSAAALGLLSSSIANAACNNTQGQETVVMGYPKYNPDPPPTTGCLCETPLVPCGYTEEWQWQWNTIFSQCHDAVGVQMVVFIKYNHQCDYTGETCEAGRQQKCTETILSTQSATGYITGTCQPNECP